MKVGIRWSGIGVLAGVLALLALVWFLLVDWVVERAIEETGTEIVGARVDLDAADVSLLPAGIELRRLQVTNPSEPMTNAVEIARIAGLFDLGRALIGQTIFEELAVEDVRFGTPRASSGAIGKRRTEALAERAGEEAARLAALVAGEMPDPDALAAQAEARARAEIASVQQEVEAARERWSERLAELPSRDRLDGYRERVETLRERITKASGADALAAAADAQKLVTDVRSDVQALETAVSGLQEEQSALAGRVRELVDAKVGAVQQIRAEYGLSKQGLSNLSRLLFGPRARAFVDRLLLWHGRLEPLIDRVRAPAAEGSEAVVVEPVRGRSVVVVYPESDALPEFLVRRAAVSVGLASGRLEGRILDWTTDQPLLGRPTTAHFDAERVGDMGPVRLDATFDRVRPGKGRDTIEAEVAGVAIEGFGLAEGEGFALRLDRGRADLRGKVTWADGALDAKLGVDVRQAALTVGSPDDPISRALADALAGVESLRIDASVRGAADDYAISLSSSLDDVLRQAIGRLVEERVQALSQQVGDALEGRLAESRAALESSWGSFTDLGDTLEQRTALARDVLAQVTGLGGAAGKPTLPGGLRLP